MAVGVCACVVGFDVISLAPFFLKYISVFFLSNINCYNIFVFVFVSLFSVLLLIFVHWTHGHATPYRVFINFDCKIVYVMINWLFAAIKVIFDRRNKNKIPFCHTNSTEM